MTLIHGLSGMEAEAKAFVDSLPQNPNLATIAALTGELGAGKTAFVKGIAKALGIEEHVTSPTFVIEKIYHLDHPYFDKLIHIDAYRLKGAHHLNVLGWQNDIQDPKNLICIEWPEQADGAIPKGAIQIKLVYIDENTRDISYGH